MASRNKALALIVAAVIATLIFVSLGHGAKVVNAHYPIKANDGIATAVYLDAEYRALLSIKADLRIVRRAITSVVTTVTRGCPRVASGVPYGSQKEEGEALATDVINMAIVRSEANIDSRFRSTVIHLRWSDPRIARLVAANLRRLKDEAEIKEPLLCRNLREWANGNFRQVPTRLTRFVRHFDDVSEGENRVPAALKKYEQPSDQGITRTINRLKPSVDRTIRLYIWAGRAHMLSALGL